MTSHIGHHHPGFDTLLIFGAGGSGREVAWLAEQLWGDTIRKLFVVDRSEYLSPPVCGIPVQLLSDAVHDSGTRFVVALGNSSLRRKAVTACHESGLIPTTLIHPRTEMSSSVKIGVGSIVSAGIVLTTNVSIGNHTYINIGCTVSHDTAIGDFSTLSPGVHIAGHVHVGKDVFIGTGASVVNGSPGAPLVVGDGTVIAAGACVIDSIEEGSLVAGVPAIRKR